MSYGGLNLETKVRDHGKYSKLVALSNKQFTDEALDFILTDAIDAQSVEFYQQSINFDMTTGQSISHMYDYKPSSARGSHGPDYTRPLFEVWRGGTHLKKRIWFNFMPSTRRVPALSAKHNSNIAADVRARVNAQPHFFPNKALVMESGATVEIKAKKSHGLLFIPIRRGEGNFRAYDYKRGFVMTPNPVKMIPGKNKKGNFTAFWVAFWNGEASNQMKTHVNLELNRMIEGKANEKGLAVNWQGMKSFQAEVSKKSKLFQQRELSRMRKEIKLGDHAVETPWITS